MKQIQPNISVLETAEDVLTMRMATGDVMNVGQTRASGECGETPLGIRRYETELDMWSDLASVSMDERMAVVSAEEYQELLLLKAGQPVVEQKAKKSTGKAKPAVKKAAAVKPKAKRAAKKNK